MHGSILWNLTIKKKKLKKYLNVVPQDKTHFHLARYVFVCSPTSTSLTEKFQKASTEKKQKSDNFVCYNDDFQGHFKTEI